MAVRSVGVAHDLPGGVDGLSLGSAAEAAQVVHRPIVEKGVIITPAPAHNGSGIVNVVGKTLNTWCSQVLHGSVPKERVIVV